MVAKPLGSRFFTIMSTSMQDTLNDIVINDDDDQTVEGSFYPSSFDIKAAGANKEA